MGESVVVMGGISLLIVIAMIFLRTDKGRKWLDSLDE